MKLTRQTFLEFLGLFILLVLSLVLRFKNLEYSDYIGDEPKAFIQLEEDQTLKDFFLSRRKGPMQFLVSHVPYLITHDFTNEYAQRIPFAVISVMAVFAFYFLTKKLTDSNLVAFIASLIFLSNGFIVGFGRIAQYQNLNLWFGFLSLFFYADLIKEEKNLLRSSLLGTLFYCLSVLSHWDAIFILPLIIFIFIKFLLTKTVSKNYKAKLLIFNFILGCALLLPFLIPYVAYQQLDTANSEYFSRRVELGHFNSERYLLLFTLYNPFFSLYFLASAALIGLANFKKNYIYLLWFIFGYGIFELFVRKPGTHIYNFLIPLFILAGLGVNSLYKLLPKYIKQIFLLLILGCTSFLFYQSYYIFIDHTHEYPWQEKIMFEGTRFEKELPHFTYEMKLPLFGFPHHRYWNEINEYINSQNSTNNESYGYMTNEVKTISEWYMDAKYKADSGFYLVGVKDPLSFVKDYSYPQIKGKELVLTIREDRARPVVYIYRVVP